MTPTPEKEKNVDRSTELLRRVNEALRAAWDARTLPASVIPADLAQAIEAHLNGVGALHRAEAAKARIEAARATGDPALLAEAIADEREREGLPRSPAGVPLDRVVADMADNPHSIEDVKTPGWKLHRCPDGEQCRASIGGGCARGWCQHFKVKPDEDGTPRFPAGVRKD